MQTDDSGYVNFTGVNAGKLGLQALASLVAVQSKVPTLAAKLSAKTTKSAEIDFTVSAKPLKAAPKIQGITLNCTEEVLAKLPVSRLYLRDWLTNYFETINYNGEKIFPTGTLSHDIVGVYRDVFPPDPIPDQFKIQTIKLSSTILIAADVSGGATPNLLGNGSVFIFPINGLSLDCNPDYSHKIVITMNICDNGNKDNCAPQEEMTTWSEQLAAQCAVYATIYALLPNVKPPKNIENGTTYVNSGKPRQWHCSTTGKYAGGYVDENGSPYPQDATPRLIATQPPILSTGPPARRRVPN